MDNIGDDAGAQSIDRNDVNVCHVCNNDVGNAHRCLTCHRYIHMFRGTGQSEEGYGQKAVCKQCVGNR